MLDLTSLDSGHLNALSRALHEARFCEEANDPIVWGSPLVVDLHVWVIEEQLRRPQRAVPGSQLQRDWLRWSGRPERATVVRRLRQNPELLAVVANDPPVLRDLLRPWSVEDEDLDAMMREARGH